MSAQPRQKTEYVKVCDLCGEPIDDRSHRDWSVLNVGHPKAEPGPPEKRAFRFFRNRHGERTSGAPRGDYRQWEWDFHGECLVDTLMPLVKPEARPKDQA